MHKTRHIYTCDQCGNVMEYGSPHELPMVHISIEPVGGEAHLHFCDADCQATWLALHNLGAK